jgi:hypothetical protein
LALDKRGTYRQIGIPQRLLRAAGVSVLILHALLMACVPQELLLLSNHDHVMLGHITPQEWQAHLKFHLQQAHDLIAGTHASTSAHAASDNEIISVVACDMSVQSTSTLALAVLPCIVLPIRMAPLAGAALSHPHALDLSPRVSVPHLPPILTT